MEEVKSGGVAAGDPAANEPAAAGAAGAVEEEEDDGLGDLTAAEREMLEERRTAEFELVSRFDKTEIDPRKECWFLVDGKWLQTWATYMEGKGEPPDRISNLNLFQEDGRTLKEGLMPKQDYRGVSPMIWYIFVELYARDTAPELCRYTMDAYAPAVVGKHREKATLGPSMKARVEVAKMREEFIESDSDSDGEETPLCCCCFYRRHAECLMFHIFTCCAYIGRRGPRYAKLQTIADSEDESEDESEEEEAPAPPPPKRKAKSKPKKSKPALRKGKHMELT